MLSKYNWMSLVTGLLLIAAAIYMFANPAIPLVVLGYVFSISVWLGGVFELVRYFGTPKQARTGWDLVDGILTVVAGLILLTASVGAQATFIPTIVGTWMIMWALIRLMTAQGMKYLSYAAGRHLQTLRYWYPYSGLARGAVPDNLRRGGSMDGSTGSSGDRSGIRG